jgi:ribonuclease R
VTTPRHSDGRGLRQKGDGRSRRDGRPARQTPTAKPLPYRVARWGKFWSLEPLFADERSCLVAKGGEPPKLDDLVLAVPVHGDRRRIVEVLGTVDDLGAVLRAMLYARGLPQGFDPEVLEEAAAVGARAAREDRGRRDLTLLPTFTIDPDTARDFDDAISVARDGDGYRAHVHIADVSYFVDDDGAIERAARRRTSSVYLPLFAEPMLPGALSSGLCSLVPRQPRKCVTAEFTFAADGRRTAVQLYRSLISSDHRLTYGFVDTLIGKAPETAHAPSPQPHGSVPDATTVADAGLLAQLRLAHELAGVLRGRRHARGALVLGSFEPEYAFDHAGELSGAVARPETPSHALVEEFMLAANEAVAEFLLRKKARTLYRVHEPPEPAKVRELLDALEELGVPTPPFPAGESVPAAQLAQAFGRLSRIVADTSAHEGRGARAWPTLLLRALKQARYSPANLGHFGLASSAYLHFTSPIRRYPDLVTHRSLLYHLGAGGGELGEVELAVAAEDCSTREREIGRLELEADDVALCFLLEHRLQEEGWEQEFAGEVIGLVGGGLFVRFGDVFEGFLSSRRLGGERFEVSEHETALVGQATARRYRLGDAVTVKVERVDRLRGRVDLAPAVPLAGGPVTAPGRVPARRSSGGRPPHRRGAGRDQGRRGR